jgi:hypothetical protein
MLNLRWLLVTCQIIFFDENRCVFIPSQQGKTPKKQQLGKNPKKQQEKIQRNNNLEKTK